MNVGLELKNVYEIHSGRIKDGSRQLFEWRSSHIFYTFYKFEDRRKREKISLPVGFEPTSPSFRGRCPNHLDDGNPISFTAFSSILLDDTMFHNMRDKYKD